MLEHNSYLSTAQFQYSIAGLLLKRPFRSRLQIWTRPSSMTECTASIQTMLSKKEMSPKYVNCQLEHCFYTGMCQICQFSGSIKRDCIGRANGSLAAAGCVRADGRSRFQEASPPFIYFNISISSSTN